MYCSQCGKELPANATTCPACGFSAVASAASPGSWATSPPSHSGDPVEEVLNETRKAARELADATARLSKRLVKGAQTAAKDPSGSARKAAKKVAQELDSAAKEIDRILKGL